MTMRDIPNYEGRYAATEDGRIYSYRRKKFLSSCGYKDDYQLVMLCDGGEKGRNYYVHRLVAMAFLPNPDNLPEVNHKDHKRDNNSVENLEWCSRKYNMSDVSHAGRKGKPVICIETNERYSSVNAAAKAIGLAQPNLSAHLNHNNPKTVGGYHWKYAEEIV